MAKPWNRLCTTLEKLWENWENVENRGENGGNPLEEPGKTLNKPFPSDGDADDAPFDLPAAPQGGPRPPHPHPVCKLCNKNHPADVQCNSCPLCGQHHNIGVRECPARVPHVDARRKKNERGEWIAPVGEHMLGEIPDHLPGVPGESTGVNDCCLFDALIQTVAPSAPPNRRAKESARAIALRAEMASAVDAAGRPKKWRIHETDEIASDKECTTSGYLDLGWWDHNG
eukprot:gene15526-biopygen7096